MATVQKVSLEQAKQYLDVLHSYDNDKLQQLLDAAHDQALQFLNLCSLDDLLEGSSEGVLPAAVQLGVLIYLQAAYQATPDDAEQLTNVAERTLMPYRKGWGV